MDEKLKTAIEVLASKIVTSIQPDQALKFTQAALNLAHAKSILSGAKPVRNKGAGV